ncbi:MAG: DUF6288 domain-containing protein [Mariniblastus sp.]|nr:DUF6288 domain-containing protein [Mariniblastus sp.]
MIIRIVLLIALFSVGIAAAQEGSFYNSPGLFSTRPSETKSVQEIKRFGPVGLGLELHQPAFVLKIKTVEKGSPAETTGRFQPGQVIERINGQTLANIDPRIQLGQILAEAESSDGRVELVLQGEETSVIVQVPVLGTYSKTWPLNCEKSDKIVRQVSDYLRRPDSTEGLGGVGMLFLLSTGESEDLEFVRKWARVAPAHSYPWYVGYGGIPLTECYLRTGDPEILENIQKWVDSAAKTQHNDAWAGRGSALTGYGSGHLNAAGTHVLTFLLLAKECGANVPGRTLNGALRHFYRYAGRGNNPYGDDQPFTGFVDNGKNGKLAIAMAAAAALTPQGEDSVYARARDVCAMQSFYSTTFMLHGHTGGGIGEIWRSAAMGLLYEKKPNQYREFMDNRRWHYDLSRRFDGSFGILGGSGYDKELWGIALPLAYTMPRKTLRISGAARTKYSKPFLLPEQPWGTDADDKFLSLEPVPESDGKQQDLSGETLARDSSLPFLRRFHGDIQPTDDEVRQYMLHPDFNIRNIAAFKVLGVNCGYIGKKTAGGQVRQALLMEFLKHNDPRVRRAMFGAVMDRSDNLTPEIFELAVSAVRDPSESWFIKDAAIRLIGRGSVDQILPLVDLLVPYLQHEEAWLRNAALTALTPVAADDRCYEKVLPAMGELVRNNQRVSVTHGFAPAIRAKIKTASSAAQRLATETLKETYTGYAGLKTSAAGQNLRPTYDYHLEAIAASLADVPGGFDVLYKIARDKYPNEILPYKEIFLAADSSQFGSELKQAINPIIMNELIPEFVGRNRKRLIPLAANQVVTEWPGGRGEPMDELVALYERAGHKQFGWNMFVDLRNASWSFFSFDPIPSEHVPFDQLVSRYRAVSLPGGMNNWFSINFDAEKAGWKTGNSPFGNYDGKIPHRPITKCSDSCVGPGCYGATPINSLWQKEVLLLRGTFKIPPIKEGFRYRLRVNTGEHVGAGGGHLIYLNGKKLIESKQGGGRGSGGRPKGALITEEFREELKRGEVTIAVKTFIRYNDKYSTLPSSRLAQGKFSLHFDEQQLPPMGDELVFKSANVVPMLSSAWQEKQDPEVAENDPNENLFRYDGTFVRNNRVKGAWRLVAEVAEISQFDPLKKRTGVRNPPFSTIEFLDGGTTSEPTWAWSDQTLMDLNRYQALKMKAIEKAGKKYLFVESGGFSQRNKLGWKSRWHVLEPVER